MYMCVGVCLYECLYVRTYVCMYECVNVVCLCKLIVLLLYVSTNIIYTGL